MSNKKWLLAILAITLVLFSGIGVAYAYFTTYAEAKGGYVIRVEPEIEETYVNKTKQITIKNGDGASSAIFVRLQVSSPSSERGYEVTTPLTTGWTKNGDWWYYNSPVDGGSSTSEFDARIEKIPEDLVDGADFNIIVVAQYVLAVYDANGDPDMTTSWANGGITINTGTNG